jgi:N-acetylmuramoyl-L-alanine amidase
MKILNHRLCKDDGTSCDYRRSPNQSGPIEPEYLIMHYTAGRNAQSSINWLVNPQASASAHLVIGADGGITQLVALNRKAWHAGPSQWGGRVGLNSFSIGIELDNPGLLTRRATGWFTWWGDSVDDMNVVEAIHKNGGPLRGWHAYSGAQLEVAMDVASLLVRRYELRDVVGHDDIAPGRKVDPGPAFPMDSFRARVIGRKDDDPELFETIVGLNIRVGAGTQHEKLPVSPLPTGTRLEVVAQQGSWRLVDVLDSVKGETDVQGWVHGRYIRRVA